MQNFLLIFGAILLLGAGGRALFQLIFLVIGAAGQAGTSLARGLDKDELAARQTNENLAEIKAFNQARLRRLLILAAIGAVGGLMIYISGYIGS